MLAERITSCDSYAPRAPRKSPYFKCVEDNFEELEGSWESKYQKSYGYWRPFVTDVIYEYLDCGDLHKGFARVKCNDCNHEYLLPFSCKKRHSGCMGEQLCEAKRPASVLLVTRSV